MLNKYNLCFKDKILEKGFCESELKNILNSTKAAMVISFAILGIALIENVFRLISIGSGIEILISIITQAFCFAILYLCQLRFHCVRYHIGSCLVIVTYLIMNEVNIYAYPKDFLFQYTFFIYIFLKVFVVSNSAVIPSR